MNDVLTKLEKILDAVSTRAKQAGVFDQVKAANGVLTCVALGCEAEAHYRVREEDGRVWVSFVTPDRWLSESIEADLEHTGDHLDELIEEELAEFDIEVRPTYEHFRSEDRLFTFRTPVPVESAADEAHQADLIGSYLLAYEAAFRELGDVSGSDDEF